MVVFACSQCGQSIKKNQVEKHVAFQCRGCLSLSCMDCGKIFWGDEYNEHTKCITEDQKYGGKNYQAKANSNKGEVKQEKWIEHIKNTIATKKLSGPLSSLLQQIIQYSNIPRKQAKFENFLKNSLKFQNTKLISEAWEIFAQGTAKDANSQQNGTNASQKRPLEDSAESTTKKPCVNGSRNGIMFNWTEEIEKILSSLDSAVPMAKLRKMVVAQYKASVKDSTLTNEELKKKFRYHATHSELFTITKVE